MKKITIKNVKDRMYELGQGYIDLHKLVEVCVTDFTTLLNIATGSKNRNIQKAKSTQTCELCDHYGWNVEGNRECILDHSWYVSEENHICHCGKRCPSRYIQEIEKNYTALLDALQNNDISTFLDKCMRYLDKTGYEELENVEVGNFETLKKYIHYRFVERAQCNAKNNIKNAKAYYEKVKAESAQKIKEAYNCEAQFWTDMSK